MNERSIIVHLHSPGGGFATIEGTPEMVNNLIAPYLKDGEYSVSSVEAADEKDTPALVQNASVPSTNGNGLEPHIPDDLVTFYRKTKPENQYEEVLVIVYYLKHVKGMADVTKDDVAEGYTQLRFVPVKSPKDMKGAVRNTVDRTRWLRNADRGRYAITLVGEEYIATMLQR